MDRLVLLVSMRLIRLKGYARLALGSRGRVIWVFWPFGGGGGGDAVLKSGYSYWRWVIDQLDSNDIHRGYRE